jgi:predicted ABC-type ATPase
MEEEIYQRLTEKANKPKKYKLALFICGASGTGKSSLRYKFLNDAKIKTSFVYLNIDDIREVGREEARVIFNHSLVRAIEDGYSIFYDGTCRNKKDVSDTIKLLKSKNYKIILAMTYTSLPTALKRLEDRQGQFVSESVARDIYQHMSKNAETYMKLKEIDQVYLYLNETKPELIVMYDKPKKAISCRLGAEREHFYFDISKYCDTNWD